MMDIKLELVLQEPISYNGTTIYQPTISEIRQFGMDNFNQLLLPYSLSMDTIEVNLSDEEKSQLKIFDIVFRDTNTFNILVSSLVFFCKTENISMDENGIKIDEFYLNRDNFEEFGDVILKINIRERPKPEFIPVFNAQKGTPEYEDALSRWNNLQEGRRKRSQQNELHIYDIINTCEFGGDYYIPIETIRNWTLYKLITCYKSKLGMSNYKDSFSIYLISGEKSLVENHWTQQIKVS